MKLYTCSRCGTLVYFENSVCLNCSGDLGFDATSLDMFSVTEHESGACVCEGQAKAVYFCANHVYGTCNWLVSRRDDFCTACALNRTIPSLSSDNLIRWKQIEVAKHRLVYSLLRLKLPVKPKREDERTGIAFDFLADVSQENRVMTGHNNGVITLNIEEADEAERVRNKLDLGEKYRTLLGHFRHEVGHHYWNVLIADTQSHGPFRELFGDESQNYNDALRRYYEAGPGKEWSDNFISPYATSHPWEDWAETWAHYMHLMDTMETAYFFGIGIHPLKGESIHADLKEDPHSIDDFQAVFDKWLPLSFALTSLNRSMGHNDFYPFVIAPKVVKKLSFIHRILSKARLKAVSSADSQIH